MDDIEVKMPDIGLDEVEVIEILVKLNEKVKLEQSLITVEGEKASMEIPSPISGIIKYIYIEIGHKVKSFSPIMIIKVNNDESLIHKKKKIFLKKEEILVDKNINLDFKKNIFIHATPVIRRLARKLNINLYNITGTGRKNRILKEDIESYQIATKDDFFKENIGVSSNNLKELKIKTIELSSLQKITGKNLHQNWINIPHVTQFDEVNITLLENFRQKYNCENKDKKNITMLVFIIKVVAYALKKFPIFNSSLTLDNKSIVLKEYINIGIAVDINNSLFVPVLKDVNKKNIEQLFCELQFLLEKARKRTLNVSDMNKGCFTISNLGGIGGSWFSPIINAPEVAILGISKSQMKPLWNGKEFIPALMLPLSLSYDHRVINGADAARFITFINKLLSDMHFLIM